MSNFSKFAEHIVAGLDTMSNINSTNNRQFIYKPRRIKFTIETGNGDTDVSEIGYMVFIVSGEHWFVVPNVQLMINSNRECILSMSYMEHVLKLRVDYPRAIYIEPEVALHMSVRNGLYLIGNLQVLTAKEVDYMITKEHDLALINKLSEASQHTLPVSDFSMNNQRMVANLQQERSLQYFNNDFMNTKLILRVSIWNKLKMSHGPFLRDVYSIRNNENEGCTKVGLKEKLVDDSFWNFPELTREKIYDAAVKQTTDFETSPLETKFAFCGPDIAGMPHKKLLDSTCDRAMVFEPGTRNIFTVQDGSGSSNAELDDNGRVFISPLDFGMCIWTRDALSQPKMDKIKLLHARFHLNKHEMRYYLNNNISIGGVKLSREDRIYDGDHCALCIKANMRKKHFNQSNRDLTELEVFEYVAVDLHGPFYTEGYDGSYFVLGFLCIKSKWDQLYCIPTKNMAYERLKSFMLWIKELKVERKITFIVRILKTDDDTVFKSAIFKERCAEYGYVRKITAPYMSGIKNPFRESRWRFLMNKRRVIMLQMKVPAKYWPLAVKYAALVIHVTHPVESNDNLTPYEAVFKHRFDTAVLSTFWSPAYSYIDSSQRLKEEDHAREGRYVGYSFRRQCNKIFFPPTSTLNRGMVRVLENINELRLNTTFKIRNLDLWDTENFRKLAQMEKINLDYNFEKVQKILENKAYFDPESDIYYGVIKLKTSDLPSDQWFYVTDFLLSCMSNYELYKKYKERTMTINEYYPINSEHRLKDNEIPGIITSIDPTAERSIQMVFPNGFTKDVKLTDVVGLTDKKLMFLYIGTLG